MAKDPAFLFYPGDWYLGTMTYSLELKGAYMELLILQFQNGGFTEAHAKHMLGVCFSTAWPILKSKFTQQGELYYNERLKFEIEKRARYSESRRNNANSVKKSRKDSEAHEQAYAKHMRNHMDDHMENENENRNINGNNTTIEKEKLSNQENEVATPPPQQQQTPNTKSKKPEAFDFPLPFDSEEFKNAWARWHQYRKQIKKPYVEISQKTVLSKLKDLGEKRSIDAINYSIGQQYQGLFEENKSTKNDKSNDTPTRFRSQRVEPRGEEFTKF